MVNRWGEGYPTNQAHHGAWQKRRTVAAIAHMPTNDPPAS